MTHADLVQTSIELLAETTEPSKWLGVFDNALESASDEPLADLVVRLQEEVQSSRKRVAA